MKHISQRWLTVCIVASIAFLVAAAAHGATYCCKYCGHKAGSVGSLTGSACQRHPDGPWMGRHALYEGGEKSVYTCKWCGKTASDISSLTSSKCQRHPNGPAAGRHEQAL